ncbi:dnaJ [Symbiodinium natans]|uniref:DnaJ protein n=1 Tax=Symbiodinium natans TaxID=878477 RepID=A0A812LNB0_9DINO|nr:dnaJ [Symbiodinium natans]
MASSVPVDFSSGDHYAVLGVPRTASEAEIAKAYRSLALRYHPDKNQSKVKDAEVGFKRISEAYSVLRDPQKRAEYDRTGGTRSYVSYDEAEQMWRQFSGEGRHEAEEDSRPNSDLQNRRKAMAILVVLGLFVLAPNLLIQVLPGLTAAVVGFALLTRRENASKWAWCALALLLASYVAPWVLRARSSFEPMAGTELHGLGETESSVPVGTPNSGEEVLIDGQFLRVADPTHRNGPVSEGWQQRLLGEMTEAIKKGREQVLMVFSREGCPWCQRQLPVLQAAIAKRAGVGTQDVEAQPAFLAPSGTAAVGMAQPPANGLSSAPLRVFIFYAGSIAARAVSACSSCEYLPVLEAEEFQNVAQAFKVEAICERLCERL